MTEMKLGVYGGLELKQGSVSCQIVQGQVQRFGQAPA